MIMPPSIMRRAVNEISSTMNDGAAGTNNIELKTSDTVEEIAKIKNFSNENLRISEELHNLIEKFKL
jgi:methyl-accepting chemotaxis protein